MLSKYKTTQPDLLLQYLEANSMEQLQRNDCVCEPHEEKCPLGLKISHLHQDPCSKMKKQLTRMQT